MTYANQLADLGAPAMHIELAEFIAANLNGAEMPDYKAMDLMQIPHLVPRIWVIDAREGVGEVMKILFTGTEIDHHFGRNLMGGYLVDNNAGVHSREVYDAYCSVFNDKRPVFTERSDYYPGVEPEVERRIRAVLFPCSRDGETVDFGIGLATFERTDRHVLDDPVIAKLIAPDA